MKIDDALVSRVFVSSCSFLYIKVIETQRGDPFTKGIFLSLTTTKGNFGSSSFILSHTLMR
uniref:Predicted protein n=1 Tax=Hordeum vulgare subsp. vulgare TaxID=112509 RepID=F2DYF0_HORVV|nr:predicted protein [Hordeum vulgare subsp. vulgare]